jgi:hypothetical protein
MPNPRPNAKQKSAILEYESLDLAARPGRLEQHVIADYDPARGDGACVDTCAAISFADDLAQDHRVSLAAV